MKIIQILFVISIVVFLFFSHFFLFRQAYNFNYFFDFYFSDKNYPSS